MKKSLYSIIIAVFFIIIVIVFFYLTRNEADETNSNLNQNTNSEPIASTCQLDDDCIGTCTCGCIHISATCPTDAEQEAPCLEVPLCKCEDGSCLEKSLEENVNQNINTNQAAEEEEETEAADGTAFTKTGNLTGDTASGFTLVYEESGAPALTAILNFDYPGYTSSCTVDGVPMTCLEAIDQELIIVGDLVTVTGTEVSDGEVAVTMLDK